MGIHNFSSLQNGVTEFYWVFRFLSYHYQLNFLNMKLDFLLTCIERTFRSQYDISINLVRSSTFRYELFINKCFSWSQAIRTIINFFSLNQALLAGLASSYNSCNETYFPCWSSSVHYWRRQQYIFKYIMYSIFNIQFQYSIFKSVEKVFCFPGNCFCR